MEQHSGKLSRRDFLKTLAAGTLLAGTASYIKPAQAQAAPAPGPMSFTTTGHTDYGDWHADVSVSPTAWQPGVALTVTTALRLTELHFASLSARGPKIDGFCALLTAERTFDADGLLRLGSDERMSTLLTPTGLAIEGGVQGAVTNRFGYGFRTPVDALLTQSLANTRKLAGGEIEASFSFQTALPDNLPPGLYRVRLDYGLTARNAKYNLNGEAFAKRPFFKGEPTCSHVYSSIIPASAMHVSGRWVNALAIQPRIPWVILGNYNSNGYTGVVADEDRPRFALSQRNLIHDEVVLPRFGADNKTVMAYSLEPQFPADIIEARSAIPWDYTRGELSIQVTGPDGKTADLGKYPFAGKAGNYPTTRKAAFTAWRPPAYGYYTVKASGWTMDTAGQRYEGGGTYHFWIAKRMTMATATFQGFAYPVGSKYGRDIGFAPACPAQVEITATLYPNSDVSQAKSVSMSGTATPGGIYGVAQGMQQLALDAPGEYHAHVFAKYTDQDGHLWVCTMRHAGVVYAPDSPIVARGKKLNIGGKFAERGETHTEGWMESEEISHLQHINYPFYAGDVLLIASEGQGANKIEPVLNYELKTNPAPYDPRLISIGASNLQLRTSNGYSPHLFPEYITDWAYYYAGAPRPGFMSRFLVSEDGARAPYWPVSPNSFGGQVNASANGDLPGDIYRLIGGIVLRRQGEAPAYAGYLSSAFLLPRFTQNNRVIAAGSEDVLGPSQQPARFFLVGTRPGMAYEVGTLFAPAVQIDPVLPANLKFTLTYPDGRQAVATGTGDNFGSWAGKDKWALDVPGVYRFTLVGEWQGYQGSMPGLPAGGGFIFVFEKERPTDAPRLKVDLSEQSSFLPQYGTRLTGMSTAKEVYYAAVIPGAVVDQGVLPVAGGKFDYFFNPNLINKNFPTYDTLNRVDGRAQIGDVVHLTLFAREVAPGGVACHSFLRLIIRGTTILNAY